MRPPRWPSWCWWAAAPMGCWTTIFARRPILRSRANWPLTCAAWVCLFLASLKPPNKAGTAARAGPLPRRQRRRARAMVNPRPRATAKPVSRASSTVSWLRSLALPSPTRAHFFRSWDHPRPAWRPTQPPYRPRWQRARIGAPSGWRMALASGSSRIALTAAVARPSCSSGAPWARRTVCGAASWPGCWGWASWRRCLRAQAVGGWPAARWRRRTAPGSASKPLWRMPATSCARL